MDPIQTLLSNGTGRTLLKRVGVAPPPTLRRHEPGAPLLVGPAVAAAAGAGALLKPAVAALEAAGARVLAGTDESTERLGLILFDAGDISDPAGLVALHEVFPALLRRLAPSGRVVVLSRPHESAGDAAAVAAQRAVPGFVRALAKELRGGATANLVVVGAGAEEHLASTVCFLASARSAFVDGQVVRLGAPTVPGGTAEPGADTPLAGRVVAVTGASRGIGAAMVRAFARDGAHVVGIDVAAGASPLADLMAGVGGAHVVADVTAPDAGARIAAASRAAFGRLDGIVHNAGITRDKKLVNMSKAAWDAVIAVNLEAPRRITLDLLEEGALTAGGRVVLVSSIAGIAGNLGQTNYAASKAGVIGLVEAFSAALEPQGITVNAVAPGFIETAMTKAVPFGIREAGRRLSSLRQGGLPVDVAETVGWMLDARSDAVTGNVVRVCGQGLIGA
ncbi:3-oxoacyl-ACP reductase [Kineosporia sp. A_224]|uniref:3-oxoacyl-ACP reductase n=1 Tax=Kineosporia sp. A_224 TaxID=1962180 RepID=UPI000B4ADC31|nr:3-oxoacyl-ACP reductase [Kineosporia sp. A_224]